MQAAQYQATQLSWALQAALTAGIAVAGCGVALTFRRPAMRALAATFLLVTVASAAIWATSAAMTRGMSPVTTTLLIALTTPLTPVLTFLFFRHIILVLAGRSTRAFPSAHLIVTAAAGGFVVSVTIAMITAPSGPIAIAILGTAGALLSFAWLALMAGRVRRVTGHRAWALRLFQWSFVALTLRSATNVIVAGMAYASGATLVFSLPVTVVQAFLLVIAGMLQLVAVLDEERSHSLAQAAQLHNAAVSAEASQRMESLGQMAGGVAHDFNNVLAVILGSAQAAMATGSGAREELAEIESAAKRGRDLTRQLVAFARPAPERVARFDATVQLERMRGMLQRIVGARAKIVLSVGDGPLYVEMDATQFDQVAMNLVTNARDAAPAGGTITVQLAAAPADAALDAATGEHGVGFVRLSVADTGPGIPASVLPHIFEPFFTTKKAGEGTGLGLATCDTIVRRVGGRIEVTSAPGKGTRFDVLIPRPPAP